MKRDNPSASFAPRLIAAAGGIALTLALTLTPGGWATAQVLPIAGNPRQAAIVDQAQIRARTERDEAAQGRANQQGELRSGTAPDVSPTGTATRNVPNIYQPTPSAFTPRTGTTGTGMGGSLSGTAGATGIGGTRAAAGAMGASGVSTAVVPGAMGDARSTRSLNSGGTVNRLPNQGLGANARTPYSTVPAAGAAAGAATQSALAPMVGTGGTGIGVGSLRGSGIGGYGGTTIEFGANSASGVGVGAVSPPMGGLGQTTTQPGTAPGGVGLGATSSPTGGLGGPLTGSSAGGLGAGGSMGSIGTAGGGAITGSSTSGGGTSSGLGASGGGAGAGGS